MRNGQYTLDEINQGYQAPDEGRLIRGVIRHAQRHPRCPAECRWAGLASGCVLPHLPGAD